MRLTGLAELYNSKKGNQLSIQICTIRLFQLTIFAGRSRHVYLMFAAKRHSPVGRENGYECAPISTFTGDDVTRCEPQIVLLTVIAAADAVC